MSRIVGTPDAPMMSRRLALSGAGNPTIVVSSLFNEAVEIYDVVLNVTTGSSGASTLDVGTADDATTSNDYFFDGVNGQTVQRASAQETTLVNGRTLAAGKFFNIAKATGNVTGLVGTVEILYRIIG